MDWRTLHDWACNRSKCILIYLVDVQFIPIWKALIWRRMGMLGGEWPCDRCKSVPHIFSADWAGVPQVGPLDWTVLFFSNRDLLRAIVSTLQLSACHYKFRACLSKLVPLLAYTLLIFLVWCCHSVMAILGAADWITWVDTWLHLGQKMGMEHGLWFFTVLGKLLLTKLAGEV